MPALLRSLARTAAPGLLFFLAACQRPPVATVNGQAISVAELDAQARVFQSMRPGTPDDEARRQALDLLIKQTLLAQAAHRAGVEQDPAFQAQLKERREGSRSRLKQAIHDAQAQLAVVDMAVERQALAEAWSRQQRGGLTITAQDLRAAYDLRARSQALPPFPAVRDQLLEQLILDRLVDAQRPHADVKLGDRP